MAGNAIEWKSEAEALPDIAETVLLATPRQFGDVWDIRTAKLLISHEGVLPLPVMAGKKWPTNYWWGVGHGNGEPVLVTGNSWWAKLDKIPLPPGAAHATGQMGDTYIAQPVSVWIPPSPKG